MVPSMDLLKALFSFCLERLNWLKQIPDIQMPLCLSKLQSDIAVFISCINESTIQIWSSLLSPRHRIFCSNDPRKP